jgi:hypothetical protein
MKITIHINIFLSVVLNGCETWPLSLKEERRPGVSENRVLKKIFGPKRDEVSGERIKPNNEKLSYLYSLPIIRVIKSRIRWEGHVACRGEERSIKRLWGNLRKRDHSEDSGVDGRIILKRIFRKWDGGMDCIDLAEDSDTWPALVHAVMNLRFL